MTWRYHFLWPNWPQSWAWNDFVYVCELIILVVGILGNLLNVVVFRHKNMGNNPINSIFWWLSISDLLELTILALYQWELQWSGTFTTAYSLDFYYTFFIEDFIRQPIYTYLFLVVHTMTICFHIVLVFCQYMIVAYPLMNHENFINDRSIKRTVICLYILSFVLYLPFWYLFEIGKVYEEEQDWHVQVKSYEEPLAYICIIFCGIVLRIGPLIILIIMCTLLLFAIKHSHCNRQRLGMEDHHLSTAQRNVSRMNITIIVIILMFFITEVPLGMESVFIVSGNRTYGLVIQDFLLLPFILLNCSYSIFCYVFRIEQYRETLKLLLLVSKTNNYFRIHVVFFIAGPLILLHFIIKKMNE